MPHIAHKPLPRPELVPTDEQAYILGLVASTTANLLINALAGSGKTSTLELIQDAVPPPVLCLAFNKRIADTMKTRFRSTTDVRTLNSLGHRIWNTTCGGRAVVEKDASGRVVKTQNILRQIISELPKPAQREAYDVFSEVVSAVALAKSLGYVPAGKFPNAKRLCTADWFYARLDEKPSDVVIDLVEDVLFASIKASYAGSIDYNDQVYMPALFGGTYPRHAITLVDEAQDLSPVNHEMLGHLKHSRIIAVGDPWQSIYQFRGAMQGGMAKLRERFEMTEADLSVSFRCPRRVVESVHWRVPHMKWIKEGGRVAAIRNPTANTFADDSAILCRNNAPLFALALRLLRSGRSVSVSGSDIGPRVVAIMRKLGDDSMSKEQLLNAIENWRQEKLAKESKTAGDIADCMRVFAQQGRNLAQACAYANDLFAQTGTLHLLTGHKAKGLEWPIVYHLDPFLIGEGEQELNLRYVIQTRAEDQYYEIESEAIDWKQ